VTVAAVKSDPGSRTLTIEAEFEAAVERVWRLWSEPQRLARWWGPPNHELTVTAHDLRPGGEVAYFSTSPAGETCHGSWRVVAVEPPQRLGFVLMGPTIPEVEVEVAIEARGAGARMTTTMSFASGTAMEELLAIGFDRGITTAVGQADRALSAAPA
jgi:uncharacterized protein YndB with AHSA1/START domain